MPREKIRCYVLRIVCFIEHVSKPLHFIQNDQIRS